jgi:hypothetical protein
MRRQEACENMVSAVLFFFFFEKRIFFAFVDQFPKVSETDKNVMIIYYDEDVKGSS